MCALKERKLTKRSERKRTRCPTPQICILHLELVWLIYFKSFFYFWNCCTYVLLCKFFNFKWHFFDKSRQKLPGINACYLFCNKRIYKSSTFPSLIKIFPPDINCLYLIIKSMRIMNHFRALQKKTRKNGTLLQKLLELVGQQKQQWFYLKINCQLWLQQNCCSWYSNVAGYSIKHFTFYY